MFSREHLAKKAEEEKNAAGVSDQGAAKERLSANGRLAATGRDERDKNKRE